MNKFLVVAFAIFFSACSDSRYNYEFESHIGLLYPLRINQNDPPTGDQIASMAEVAGRSAWRFCARMTSQGRHECVHGVFSPTGRYPDDRTCRAALSSINSILNRINTADQIKVCGYAP